MDSGKLPAFGAKLTVRAILVGDRIDTAGLERSDTLSTLPLHLLWIFPAMLLLASARQPGGVLNGQRLKNFFNNVRIGGREVQNGIFAND